MCYEVHKIEIYVTNVNTDLAMMRSLCLTSGFKGHRSETQSV